MRLMVLGCSPVIRARPWLSVGHLGSLKANPHARVAWHFHQCETLPHAAGGKNLAACQNHAPLRGQAQRLLRRGRTDVQGQRRRLRLAVQAAFGGPAALAAEQSPAGLTRLWSGLGDTGIGIDVAWAGGDVARTLRPPSSGATSERPTEVPDVAPW